MIVIQMTRDRTIYDRSDYTFLQFLGDISALYDAIHIGISILLVYGLQIGTILDNSILNRVFKKSKPFTYPRLCTNKRFRKIGQRRIDRELDIEHFIRK
jgi:hypothetical protein